MNSQELYNKFVEKKDAFRNYIKETKLSNKADIYNIINPTLVSNPYVTNFPKEFFLGQTQGNKGFYLLKGFSKFYLKMFTKLVIYFFLFIIFKIFYRKKSSISKDYILFDIFLLVKNTIKDNNFSDTYFKSVYPVLDDENIKYAFIVRLYGIGLNLVDFIKVLKVTNKSRHNFIYEFELLRIRDFFSLSKLIFFYPFKVMRLLKKEKIKEDYIFNINIVKDIASVQFDAFTRYIFGKNFATYYNDMDIYSWSEFQDIERSFNLGIRENSDSIQLIGCQFYLNFETYFSIYLQDEDHKLNTAYEKVLVNGKYYVQQRKNIKYELGVSLRYNNVFSFEIHNKEANNVLVLGSYILRDTENMLRNLSSIDNLLFKNHPVLDIKKLGTLVDKVTLVDDNIYTLFNKCSIVIGISSGTLVEAVACGKSVIVVASEEYLTANPLVYHGKGKIWDIAFSKDDVKIMYNKLKTFRENNFNEIKSISMWYRDNFFVEPSKSNILKIFKKEEK